MDLLTDFDARGLVITELAQGRELAEQLQKLDPSSSDEEREFLTNRILSVYEKALSLISSIGLDHSPVPSPSPTSFHRGCSPQSSRGSTHDGDHPRPSKRRKTLPKRAEKVKVGNGEALPSDGYSWRKYGQKTILGAKFRRGYYRCTHRQSHGCLALRQVQQSDEDPTVFQVIYVGEHTCTPHTHVSPPSATRSPPRVIQAPPQQALPVLQPQLPVETEGLDNGDQDKLYLRSISFSAVFGASAMLDCDHLLSDSDPPVGFSAPNSEENSPINKLEYTLEELGIDPYFPFDDSEMFH